MSAQPMLMPDVEGLARQVDPLSRRGFFLTASAAAAAGYTLAAGPVRADAIQTDTAGLTIGDAKVKVSDGEMPVYFARPANVQNPPVILVAMEIFGLHEYIKDVTRRLGIMGFCRGGRTVWEYAAHNKDLKAAVAFYGTVVDPPAQKSLWPKSPTELAPDMKAPVLGLYGEADQGIPVAQVDAMKSALQGAGKTFEIKIYPAAPHGFHADYRASYRKDAAEDAWNQMIAWFKKYGVLT